MYLVKMNILEWFTKQEKGTVTDKRQQIPAVSALKEQTRSQHALQTSGLHYFTLIADAPKNGSRDSKRSKPHSHNGISRSAVSIL